jgi:hypothetical protein
MTLLLEVLQKSVANLVSSQMIVLTLYSVWGFLLLERSTGKAARTPNSYQSLVLNAFGRSIRIHFHLETPA